MNTIVIHGYLGKDAESKEIDGRNGEKRMVHSFSLGSRRPGKSEKTDWFRCDYFSAPNSSMQEHLVKGKEVVINGWFKVDSVEKENKDGDTERRWYHTVVANTIEFAGKKADSVSNTSRNDQGGNDLPF